MYGKRTKREKEREKKLLQRAKYNSKKKKKIEKHWRNLLDLYSFRNEILVNDLLNFCQLKSIYNVNFYYSRMRNRGNFYR